MGKLKPRLCFFLLFPLAGLSQTGDPGISLLKKLDSLSHCSTISRYFSSLYFEATLRSLEFFGGADSSAKRFIERFETRFAGFFFRAVTAYNKRDPVPVEWRPYFGDSALTPLQYRLLGINAHINGDIWQALTAEFSLGEIRENKKAFTRFNKELEGEYRSFYNDAIRSDPAARRLHRLSLGLARPYGELILRKWRKRQVKLTTLFFTNRAHFEKSLNKLHTRMNQIDRLILRHL